MKVCIKESAPCWLGYIYLNMWLTVHIILQNGAWGFTAIPVICLWYVPDTIDVVLLGCFYSAQTINANRRAGDSLWSNISVIRTIIKMTQVTAHNGIMGPFKRMTDIEDLKRKHTWGIESFWWHFQRQHLPTGVVALCGCQVSIWCLIRKRFGGRFALWKSQRSQINNGNWFQIILRTRGTWETSAGR